MKYEHFWIACAAAGATAVVLGGAATVALAQQTTTIVGERSTTERIAYSDLNLAAPRGKLVLKARVERAVRNVCRPDNDSFGDHIFNECASFAMNGARPQMALAVRRSREIAATGTSSIPLVAISIVGMR